MQRRRFRGILETSIVENKINRSNEMTAPQSIPRINSEKSTFEVLSENSHEFISLGSSAEKHVQVLRASMLLLFLPLKRFHFSLINHFYLILVSAMHRALVCVRCSHIIRNIYLVSLCKHHQRKRSSICDFQSIAENVSRIQLCKSSVNLKSVCAQKSHTHDGFLFLTFSFFLQFSIFVSFARLWQLAFKLNKLVQALLLSLCLCAICNCVVHVSLSFC